jgi:hypothetical protein
VRKAGKLLPSIDDQFGRDALVTATNARFYNFFYYNAPPGSFKSESRGAWRTKAFGPTRWNAARESGMKLITKPFAIDSLGDRVHRMVAAKPV